MRRLTSTTVAATVVSLLVLAGCSGGSGDTATPSPKPSASSSSPAAAKPTAADIAALKAVKMEGAAGAEPTVTFDMPFTVSAPVARVVTEGTGGELAKGQILAMNYIAVSGTDGAKQGTTYGSAPDHITLGDSSLIPALNDVLAGQKVGARILLAIPAPAADPAADPAATPAGTTLMAVEVSEAKTIPTRAEGDAVAPVAGQPTVTLADDGAPTIKPVKGDPPTDLVVQPLIKGAGAPVAAGQSVTFQYAGVLWDGTAFDSSWKNGAPFTTTIGSGAVIKGWDQGLVGQPVGSQVLLVVPPALGYGDKAQGPIPASSTLVFVVDILSAS